MHKSNDIPIHPYSFFRFKALSILEISSASPYTSRYCSGASRPRRWQMVMILTTSKAEDLATVKKYLHSFAVSQTRALSDIRRNRQRSTSKLIRDRELHSLRESVRRLINQIVEGDCFLPHQEPFEAKHDRTSRFSR